MDKAAEILRSLEIDEGFFIQLVVFVLLFILMKIVFLDKLLEVLKERESKTHALSKAGQTLSNEAEELEKKYNEMVKQIYIKAQEKLHGEKESIHAEQVRRYKTFESEVLEQEDAQLKKIRLEIEHLKKGVLDSKNQLEDSLLKKLV